MYNTTIDSLYKDKDKLTVDACNLFFEMFKSDFVLYVNVNWNKLSGGVKPDVTYGALMDEYCLFNEVNNSKDIFKTMAQWGVAPNVYYGIMINGFCNIKMVNEAMDFFGEKCIPRRLFPIW